MGICCSQRTLRINESFTKSISKPECLIHKIFSNLKLCHLNFRTVYKLLFKEELKGDNFKEMFIDNVVYITQIDFLNLAEQHFYEKDQTLNENVRYHELFFILLVNESLDSEQNNISCVELLLKLLSFVNDSPLQKCSYFLALNRYNLSFHKYVKIPNKKVKYSMRSYISFNLVFINKFILDLSQQNLIKGYVNNEIEKDVLLSLQNFNKDYIRSFLTGIHSSLNPASNEDLYLVTIYEFLKSNDYIFNLLELRKNFLMKFQYKNTQNIEINSFNFNDLYDEEYLDN